MFIVNSLANLGPLDDHLVLSTGVHSQTSIIDFAYGRTESKTSVILTALTGLYFL